MFTYATTLCHPAPTETPIHNHIINWSVLKSMHCSRINHSLLCQKKKKKELTVVIIIKVNVKITREHRLDTVQQHGD